MQPFATVLSDALDMPVEIIALPDGRALIDAQIGGRVEYAIHSASAFAAAWVLCKCVEPIAVPRDADGALGFSAVVLARAGGPGSASQLAGRAVVVPGAEAFVTRLTRFLLGERGIAMDGFRLTVAADGTDAAMRFAAGEGAALIGWEPADAGRAPTRGTATLLAERGVRDHKTIWRSPVVPYGAHAVRTGLSGEAKLLIWEALQGLRETDRDAYEAAAPLQEGGFVQATRADYAPVIAMVRKQLEAGD